MNKKDIIEKIYSLCLKKNTVLSIDELQNIGITQKIIKKFSISINNLKLNEYLYNNNPKKCKYCSTNIQYNKRQNNFCNRSCSTIFNNKTFIKRKSQYKDNFCNWCFKYLGKNNKLCCDRKCYIKLNFMKEFLNWYYNSGKYKSHPNKLKSFIIAIYGYSCKECGYYKHDNEDLTLHLEHIDGNSENNKKDNLCLLCPNCHSQTLTYKGRNRGKGRKKRLERYHQGKSY